MRIKLNILLLLLQLVTLGSLDAQWRNPLYDDERSVGHVELGARYGFAYYKGELINDWFPDYTHSNNFGIYVKNFWNKSLGYRAGLNYINKLEGNDAYSVNEVERARNLRFNTNIYELNLGLELNLIPFGAMYRKWSPYIMAGASIFYYNPWTDSLNGVGHVNLRPLGTEGQYSDAYPDRTPYSLVAGALYFGGGVKFLISGSVVLGAEVNFRTTSTDYLDDVSRTYVNLDTLASDMGVTSSQFSFRGDELESFNGEYPNDGYIRGNSSNKDWFYSATISLGIYFDTQKRSKPYPYSKCIRHKENNPTAF